MFPLGRLALLAAPLMLSDVMPIACGCDSSSANEVRKEAGTARITKIEPAPANGHNCEIDPVQVEFDFIETGRPAASSRDDIGQIMHVGTRSSRNPARAWLVRKGVGVGKELRCNKRWNGGSPYYTFPTLNTSDFADYCFKNPSAIREIGE